MLPTCALLNAARKTCNPWFSCQRYTHVIILAFLEFSYTVTFVKNKTDSDTYFLVGPFLPFGFQSRNIITYIINCNIQKL